MQHELKKPILKMREVESFILTNLRMKNLTEAEVRHIPITFVPNLRAVSLATFYWRSLLDIFSDCVGDILARKHFLPYKKFDGVLFQKIYKDLHEPDVNNNYCVIKKHEETYVNNVFSLVTSNGIRVA